MNDPQARMRYFVDEKARVDWIFQYVRPAPLKTHKVRDFHIAEDAGIVECFILQAVMARNIC